MPIQQYTIQRYLEKSIVSFKDTTNFILYVETFNRPVKFHISIYTFLDPLDQLENLAILLQPILHNAINGLSGANLEILFSLDIFFPSQLFSASSAGTGGHKGFVWKPRVTEWRNIEKASSVHSSATVNTFHHPLRE